MRRQKKYHYIYRTTCQITGKFYVGMHSTDNLEDGYLGSGKILGYSRKKYGDENHKKEIIEMCPTREALKLREKEIVNEQMLADALNINLKYGGEGGFEHQNLNAEVQRVKGIKGNERMRELRKANTVWASKVSANISASLKKAYAEKSRDIRPPDWTGKKHRDETKSKIGAANSKRQAGSGNSQYGTCWVIKNHPIKIDLKDLDSYLANGYRRGRK